MGDVLTFVQIRAVCISAETLDGRILTVNHCVCVWKAYPQFQLSLRCIRIQLVKYQKSLET